MVQKVVTELGNSELIHHQLAIANLAIPQRPLRLKKIKNPQQVQKTSFLSKSDEQTK